MNPVIGHQHIFYPDGTSVGYGTRAVYKDENKNEFSRCVDLEVSQKDILQKIKEIEDLEFSPEQYSIFPRALGGNNCQDFVETVTGQGGI